MAYKENHANGIGSGEIAAIAGLNPWRSRLEVWEEKCHPENTTDIQECFATRRGHVMENLLVEELGRATGIEFYQQDEKSKSEHRPWFSIERDGVTMHASPDAMAHTPDGLVCGEVKAPGINTHNQWGKSGSGANGVPPYVIAQVHWQMEAAGAKKTLVGAAIGNEFRVYEVHYNPDLAEKLLDAARNFWGCVESGEQPVADSGKAADRWLGEKHPSEYGDIIAAEDDPDLDEIVECELLPAISARKDAERLERQARNKVKQILGEAEGVKGTWGKVLWKKSKDRVITDWEAVAREALSLLPVGAGLRHSIVDKHQYVKEGARRFVAFPKSST